MKILTDTEYIILMLFAVLALVFLCTDCATVNKQFLDLGNAIKP